jgi:WD40 repeat protein/DNA-binding CsgD family transcriptional regulator/transcriptional regulator with XRE-family HTH domain
MMRHSYRERDYAFGQAMLTLRTSMGLTQSGLADLLGISRRAVGEWEEGISYPKAEHFKHFLELCVQQHVFAPGREEEEIRTLWKTAHQRVLLDEAWLRALLRTPTTPVFTSTTEVPAPPGKTPTKESAAFPRMDWVGALDVSHFTGREVELAELSHWMVHEQCRLIAILGMGGIGKSALVSLLGKQLAPQFDAVLWRSLRDAPSCEDLVADCLTFFSDTPPAEFPTSLERRIDQLVVRLQARRCLLVLDNLESLLEEEDPEGNYLPGYQGYGRLIQRLAESAHQSCVLLTSREKPREIESLEGIRSPVRSLRLVGLDDQTARDLLADKELTGTPAAWQRLVAGYAGNPLALKIVGQAVSDLFGGDLDRFLQEDELVFNGVRPVLRQQVGRLSALEHLLLTWLAVLREWTPLDTLAQVLYPSVLRAQLLEALEALRRRSLLERGQQASFSLQSVVMEYLTDVLGERLAEEIVQGHPAQLLRVALEQAQAKDYVRQTQVRLLVRPLVERLRSELGADALVEAHLLRLLEQFRSEDAAVQGYGPANVLSLLKALRGHLRGLDLSRLAIRGAYLQGVQMQDATLSGVVMRECVLSEDFDAITAVAISKSGKFWAALSRRGEMRVWREEGKRLHLAWQAHTNTTLALALSPDEHTLASGNEDGSVRLWDVESGALLWSGWHTKGTWCLAFSPDGSMLTSGSEDGSVRLWEASLGTPLEDIPHPGAVFSLAWSPDGRLLANGDVAGTIRLWERQQTGPARCVRTLSGHTTLVRGLAFSPDGSVLVSASWDSTVKLWELASGRCLETLVGHTERVQALAWSPDGGTLASGGWDHTIRLWDGHEGTLRAVLQGHSANVQSLAFTPDSRHLLSGSDDGTLRLWEVENAQCVRVMQGSMASLYDLDWSPDGRQVVTGGTDTLVTIWDVSGGQGRTLPRELRGHRWDVYGVGWSPDGNRLASSGLDHTIRLWDPTLGSCLQIMGDSDSADTLFFGLAWSPDGKLLACGTYQRGVQVWDVAANTLRWADRAYGALLRRVAWSPDGTRVAGGGNDGIVILWEATNGTQQARLQGHRGMVMSVAWSPDGRRLASGGSGREGGELFVWDADSGKLVHAFEGHPGVVSALSWVPSGEVVVSGRSDGRLRWWDLQSGECVRVQGAHQGTVQALKVSPDGSILASCGDDGAIQLWDLESGSPLQTLRRDRLYERLNITGIQGLTEAQKASLLALGAFEETGVRAQRSEEALTTLGSEGRSMTPEQALAALPRAEMPEPRRAAKPSAPSTYPAGLTEREVEVLRLVAKGLTIAQIAAQLRISFHTANAHVRSIHKKLQVTSRSAAVRYALEHHLS